MIGERHDFDEGLDEQASPAENKTSAMMMRTKAYEVKEKPDGRFGVDLRCKRLRENLDLEVERRLDHWMDGPWPYDRFSRINVFERRGCYNQQTFFLTVNYAMTHGMLMFRASLTSDRLERHRNRRDGGKIEYAYKVPVDEAMPIDIPGSSEPFSALIRQFAASRAAHSKLWHRALQWANKVEAANRAVLTSQWEANRAAEAVQADWHQHGLFLQ